MDMSKLASFAGMTVGGAIGWYAGNLIGLMTAFFLSCVGTGVGMYVARRAVQQYLVVVLAAALLTASSARAQTPTPGATKAATELMQVMHYDKTMHDQISAALQNNPAAAQYRDALQAFADKYLTWDAIGPQITAAYAQMFSESELKDLIAFYKTPTGQKLAAQSAPLVAKGQAITVAILQQHQTELAELIRQQQSGTTPPADTTKH